MYYRRCRTSRTQVDRLLDARNDITLSSLEQAAVGICEFRRMERQGAVANRLRDAILPCRCKATSTTP